MKYCYLLLLSLWSSFLAAQQHIPTAADLVETNHHHSNHNSTQGPPSAHYCASDVMRQRLIERRAELMMTEQEMDNIILNSVGSRDNELLYIPVVVHIIHNNGDENISDAQVIQGIQHMNDAFANAGDYYSPNGFDMGIRFCLAAQTPDGLPTTGINRRLSLLTEMISDSNQDLQLKNIIRWDPFRYVNIWLVKEISSNAMGNGVAGYAYFPNSHGSDVDGIVNEARWFGSNTNNSKIHVHEMGHYLGLYHTFEGGCVNNNCQTDGDRICDTPPDGNSGAFPCTSAPNTCTTDEDDTSINNPFRAVALGGAGDQNDLIEDYMDYGLQECQRLFTNGQGERMRSAIENIRYSLLESQVCETSCGIGNVSIISSSNTVIPSGTNFEASGQFIASVPVSFEWIFDGSVISTQEILSHTFNNNDIGEHYLYLNFINEADDCFLTDSILISIRCNPPATFTFSPTIIEPGELITFDGHDANATSYQWFLNGQAVGNSNTYSHTFENGGANHIYLVTGNGQCFDTSATQYLGVGACGNGANNHWIIGYTSGNQIDFSSGEAQVSNVPQIFTSTPVLNHNFLGTIEGMATISDRNGSLLFYSDGIRLFNRNYEVFYSDLGAGGSSAQGVLIIPDPADINSYYVFTAENFGGVSMPTNSGLSYLKVNMNLNNGMGGVSSTYTNLLPHCSEKLAATLHCNGSDIWVMAHGFDNDLFYAYLVTNTGVQAPVITAIGQSQYSNEATPTGIQAIGTHRFSPQGDKLLSTCTYLLFSELFDFDNSTGVLSNPFLFPTGTNAYGGEFSPDGKKLYYAAHEGSKAILRCDLSSGIPQLMTSSIAVVGYSTVPHYIGSFQLAPNGKIYIARTDSYLDVIHNPDGEMNNCGFEAENLYIPYGGNYGLNNILVPKLYDTPIVSGLTNVCVGANDVRYKTSCGENTWLYIGNNEMTVLSNKEVSIDFLNTGIDTLICHRANSCSGTGSDTLLIQVGGSFVHLGNDTTICSSTSLHLDAGQNFLSYLWNTGAQTQTINATQTGDYWVEVTAYGGCTSRDTLHVNTFNSTFDVPDVPLIKICGQPVEQFHTVHAQQGDFTHIWDNNLSTLDSYHVPLFEGNSYFVYVPITYYNSLGCADRDTITIQKVVGLPSVSLGIDTIICPGELVLISPITSAPYEYEYLWPDNSMGEDFTIYQAGIYTVRYRDSICTGWKTSPPMVVSYHPVPELTLPHEDLYICETGSYTLDAGTAYEDFIWQDGSTGRYHIVTEAGTYSVTAEAICQSVTDTIEVLIFDEIANELSFPDTLTICSNELPYTFQTGVEHLTGHQWSNGNTSENLIITQAGTYILNASNPCGNVSDTLFVVIKQQPSTVLPNDTYYCNGEESLTLHGLAGAINTWDNNVIADSIVVNETGVYYLNALLENGCTTIDSIYVEFLVHYLTPINDTVICGNSALLIPVDHNGAYLQSNTTVLGDNLLITQPGTFVAISSSYDGSCVEIEVFTVSMADTSDYEISLPEIITVCGHELPITLNAENELFYEYEWSNGDTTATTVINESGTYSVQAHYGCGTKLASTIVEVSETPNVLFASDTSSICNGAPLILHADSQYDNLWSDESADDVLVVTEPGSYWLKSTNEGGCYGIDSLIVIAREVNLQSIADTGFCAGSEVVITAISNATDLNWSTDETTSSIIISSAGEYSVIAAIEDCSVAEHFNVVVWPTPVFSLGNDVVAESGPVILAVSNTFASYEWNVANATSNTLQVNQSGTYILTVTNNYGCTYTDTVNVTITTKIDDMGLNDSYIIIPTVHSMSAGPLMARYNNVTVNNIFLYDGRGRIVSSANHFPLLWSQSVATAIYYYTIQYKDSSGISHIKQGKVLMTP